MSKASQSRVVKVENDAMVVCQLGRSSGHMVRLSDPDQKEAMAEIKQQLATDTDYAKRLLRRAGIIDGKGKLKRTFGG